MTSVHRDKKNPVVIMRTHSRSKIKTMRLGGFSITLELSSLNSHLVCTSKKWSCNCDRNPVQSQKNQFEYALSQLLVAESDREVEISTPVLTGYLASYHSSRAVTRRGRPPPNRTRTAVLPELGTCRRKPASPGQSEMRGRLPERRVKGSNWRQTRRRDWLRPDLYRYLRREWR